MHRDVPGTCAAESRPASEEGCVARAQQVSACRWAGDGGTRARRRGLTGAPLAAQRGRFAARLTVSSGASTAARPRPRFDQFRAPARADPGNLRSPGAPGGRPGFGEPLGSLCALPGPSPSSAFVFSLSFPSSPSTTLPLLQFGSCTPPACRTLQPRAAEAPSEGEASAGQGAARSEGGRAAGSAMAEKPSSRAGARSPASRAPAALHLRPGQDAGRRGRRNGQRGRLPRNGRPRRSLRRQWPWPDSPGVPGPGFPVL